MSLSKFETEQTYKSMCELAGIAPPQSHDDALLVVERATARVKTQADLLGKTMPFEVKHATCLTFLAKLHGFESWYEFMACGRRFAGMSKEERPLDIKNSILIFLSSEPPVKDSILDSRLARTFDLYAELIRQTFSLSRHDATAVLHRVMFKSAGRTMEAAHLSYTSTEVRRALEHTLNYGRKRQILSVLSRIPVKDGVRSRWSSLREIKVKELLTIPLANIANDAGIGEPGWVHLMVDTVSQMVTYGELRQASIPASFSAQYPPAPFTGISAEAKALCIDSRVACREASEQVLKPARNKSVLEALTSTEAANGFFSNYAVGTVEEVLTEWCPTHESEGHASARLCVSQPFRGFFLTLVKRTQQMESSPEAFDDLLGVLHAHDGSMVAKVNFGVYRGGSGSRHDFMWAMDELGQPDLLEVGLSLGADPDETEFYEGLFDHVAILREWEVRKDFRSQGIGRSLLEETIQRCLKGEALPSTFALRLAPAQFEVPPLDDWDRVHLPELTGPGDRLNAYWRDVVMCEGGVLSEWVDFVYHYPYVPAARQDDEVVLMAFSAMSSELA